MVAEKKSAEQSAFWEVIKCVKVYLTGYNKLFS